MVTELVSRLNVLRAELDERHGEHWPADAIEQYERALAEVREAVDAAEKRAQVLARADEIERIVQAARETRVAATTPLTSPPRTARRPRGEALRAYLRDPASLSDDERAMYLASDGGITGFLVGPVRAATPGATGEEILTPPQTAPEVKQARRQVGLMRELCSVFSTTSSVFVVPYIVPSGEFPSGQITRDWPGGAAMSTNTVGALIGTPAEQRIDRYKIPVDWVRTVSVMLKENVLDDASVDIEVLIAGIVERTFASAEDEAFLRGSGNEQPLGIISDPDVTTANSGANTGLTYNGLVDVFSSLRPEYAERATWVFHSLAIGQLLKLSDSQNRPLFAPGQTVATLFGRPLRWTNWLQSPAQNNITGIFGDFSEYYIIDRMGIAIRRLTEVHAPHTVLLAFSRKGGRVVQPEAFVKIKQSA